MKTVWLLLLFTLLVAVQARNFIDDEDDNDEGRQEVDEVNDAEVSDPEGDDDGHIDLPFDLMQPNDPWKGDATPGRRRRRRRSGRRRRSSYSRRRRSYGRRRRGKK